MAITPAKKSTKSLMDRINEITAAANEEADKFRRPLNPADLVGNDTSVIRLKTVDVRAFKDNPRTLPNANFEDIKASIKERGLDHLLTVVRIPGESYYTIAKGGKTRLRALQDLANDADPAVRERFVEYDFLIKPYSSESELMAAHLVENLQRSDMSFWDTARGIVKFRETLIRETGNPISQSELSNLLRQKGVVVDEKFPADCIFATDNYEALGDQAHGIARNHIRKNLRPNFISLAEIWRRKFGTQAATDFLPVYQAWVASFQSESFSVEELCEHLNASAASHFEISVQQLHDVQKIAHLDANKSLGLSELLESLQSVAGKEKSTGATAPSNELQGANDGFGLAGQNSDPEESDAGSQRLGDTDPGLKRIAERSKAPSISGEEDQGGEQTGIQGYAGIPSLQVKGNLVPRVPRLQEQSMDPPRDGQQDGELALAPLPTIEQARAQASDSLATLARIGGIEDLLREEAALPNEFYVEIPQRCLGTVPSDISVEAWWLLAHTSGQLNEKLLNFVPPCEFRTAVLDEGLWQSLVFNCLGTEALLDAFWALDVLINTSHPLSKPFANLVNDLHTLDATKNSSGGT
jgi:ParB family protein of integrating conjugative element (PFGI_1 class)